MKTIPSWDWPDIGYEKVKQLYMWINGTDTPPTDAVLIKWHKKRIRNMYINEYKHHFERHSTDGGTITYTPLELPD